MAIKTGTSTHSRDLWAVGYTPKYTIAVWVGNFNGRPTQNLCGATAAAPIVADLAAVLFSGAPPAPFQNPPGVVRVRVCAFSGLKPGPGCTHLCDEWFIKGTQPRTVCTYHHPKEPWLRMPTDFAGWLHQRYETGGEGRFRLAHFSPDLQQTFQPPRAAGGHLVGPRHPAAAVLAGLPAAPAALRPDGLALPVSLNYPLNGDRFLLPPGADAVRVTGKAQCRQPLKAITWFVDGIEVAATGPPYELPLKLSRGRHRITIIGPGRLADSVAVTVQ
jgi:penicillin-binding protein 1C